MTDFVLLSDISNGSSLKLALARRGQRPDATTQYACNSLDGFKTAISDFLDDRGKPQLAGAAISAAGWERGGVIKLPNHGFSINRNDMRAFLDTQRVNLVNDFVAKALAIPRLKDSERVQICGGDPVEEQVIAVIGPHNGLGMSALAPDGMGNWTAMPTEGGHSDLAATNDLEDQVLRVLAQKYGHVSRERVISIPGLSDLWRALSIIDGDENEAPSPEEIIARASAEDTRAHQVIDLSMGWFAAMASDVALILGARGGVYLSGDLLDMIGDLFDVEAFVKRYSDKGRLSGYVAEIPVFKPAAHDMEVIGLATLFD
ncbi:glucokinase [Asticcacaulis sp. EMRT-3]|uniref:glucokinase n=1 Tax=Asticcacaulis sp. EMRT-3 TaxID=3040349 RepID=UPI0024AF244A|nr:glucokinase [Asticcacaulis sp. EMRT-3]MDI7775924.1 glucokinase [Asticcacaulis sp. EMRT-3]